MKKKSLRDYFEEEYSSDEVMELLHEILERLEKIAIMLEEIKEKLDSEETRKKARRGIGGIVEHILSRLEDDTYLSVSRDLSSLKRRDELISKLKKLGAVEVNAGKDVFLFHPKGFEEFRRIIEEINTRDPVEAADKTGRYRLVFQTLLENGMIYFDARKKKWVMIR